MTTRNKAKPLSDRLRLCSVNYEPLTSKLKAEQTSFLDPLNQSESGVPLIRDIYCSATTRERLANFFPP